MKCLLCKVYLVCYYCLKAYSCSIKNVKEFNLTSYQCFSNDNVILALV